MSYKLKSQSNGPAPLIFSVLLLLFALVIIYAPIFQAPFLSWDDDYNILKNPFYVAGPWWQAWTTDYYGMYIPVTSSIWALLYHLGGGEAFAFRIFNFLFHILNCYLLTRLLFRLDKFVKINGTDASISIESNLMPLKFSILLAVGIFALHPVQVSTVAWISGGRDILAVTFALLSLLVFLSGQKWPNIFGSVLLFSLGLLCKPNIVMLPFCFALLGWIFLKKSLRQVLYQVLVMLGISAVDAFIIFKSQEQSMDSIVPIWFQPLVALDSYGFFLKKLFLPVDFAVDYGRTPTLLFENPALMVVTICLTCLGIYSLFYLGRKRAEYNLGWTWFLLLLPVTGIVRFAFQEISTVADHYHYLPMIGVSMLLFMVFRRIHINPKTRIIFPFVSLLVFSIFTIISVDRSKAWSDDEAFFGDMLNKNPRSFSAAITLGAMACESGRGVDLGLERVELAISLKPLDPVAVSNKAFCLYRLKRYSELIQFGKIFLNKKFVENTNKHDFATGSLLASIGAAAAQLGNIKFGFALTCLAAKKVPIDMTYKKSLQVLHGVLLSQGEDLSCESALVGLPSHDLSEVMSKFYQID